MRKRIATGLLGLNRAIYKLACRVYPPRVTETALRYGQLTPMQDPYKTRKVRLEGADGAVWTVSGMPPDRRESRGSEN